MSYLVDFCLNIVFVIVYAFLLRSGTVSVPSRSSLFFASQFCYNMVTYMIPSVRTGL